MASQLQPRRKDAAKTSRSLFLYNFETAIWRVVKLPLGTFHSAKAGTFGFTEGTALQLPLGTFRSLRALLGPKSLSDSLSVTGPETPIGHLSFNAARPGPRTAHFVPLSWLPVLKLPLAFLFH